MNGFGPCCKVWMIMLEYLGSNGDKRHWFCSKCSKKYRKKCKKV